ncbi:hypothetical protein [Paenibacillus sp. MMO-58]|uniref:hypothetical protein n=1 Tax=Paenibacillus sp. MMO-58 TaxID=3081290 RepID=UPI00301670D4
MMKQTKFSVLSLALAAALTIPAVINADSSEVTPTESNPPIVTSSTSPEVPDDGFESITPYTKGNQQPLTTVTASTSGAPAYFVIPAGYGHGKFYFHNTGKGVLTVTMKHSSGLEYIAATIQLGQAYTWRSTTDYPQGMRGGDYAISFQCSTGVSVEWSASASDSVT